MHMRAHIYCVHMYISESIKNQGTSFPRNLTYSPWDNFLI